jgi:4,5-dihydroxyphthalate decarboxylase
MKRDLAIGDSTAAVATRYTLAFGVYDRTIPLLTGEVTVPGADVTYVPIAEPREIFDRMAGGEEFDLAEMSMSEYICRYVAGECPFVALPVFPSRVFRHSMIAVDRRKIETPADLAGKRIGVALYTMTAAVFIRGLLAHDHGVDFSNVTWVQGAINHARGHGNPAAMPLLRPARIEQNHTGRSLSDLLDAGEIDAVIGTSMPECMQTNANVVRLFPDFREREQDYFRRTHIFPIMHAIVMRKAAYERDRSIAQRFYTAFETAKALSWKRMNRVGTLAYMLPWMIDDLDEIGRVFGGDPWPYGVEPNLPTLDALIAYLAEQDMIAHTVPAADLFVPVT